MERGNLVTTVVAGKPRPALVIQSDAFAPFPTVVVAQLTSEIRDVPIRVSVRPTVTNGLRKESQIAIDRIWTETREKLGPVIGKLDRETMMQVDRALAVFLGVAS